jgi:hypothetical protein
MLLHPKVDHEELTCDELRALAKELRVHSAMNGKSEFALYEDKAKDKDYWLATIHQPSTTTTHVNICIVQPSTVDAACSYALMELAAGGERERHKLENQPTLLLMRGGILLLQW